jgi:ABC-type polysaccharide/polyol phosphate export permease
MVLILTWWLRGIVDVGSLVVLAPVLATLLVLCWSLTTLAAFGNVYFPDVLHLAEFGLQAIFYLTPIIYPPSVLGAHGLTKLLRYNPLATLVQLLRSAILGPTGLGVAEVGIGQLAMLSACVILTVGLAVLVIARYEHKLVFEL